MNIDKLKKIKSSEELKNIGSVEEIAKNINNFISPLKIVASSYDDLLNILSVLRSKHIDFIDGPFKSKQDEFLFYLTKLEGKQRNRLLGLKDEHYTNKRLAKKWYKELSKYAHPDKGGNEKAFTTLNKIYNILIEEDEE